MDRRGADAGEIAVVVIGAGGHAAEVCSYVADMRAAGAAVRLLGCIDDHKPVGRFGPVDVLGGFNVLEDLLRGRVDRLRCITAVGDNATRRRLVARVDAFGSPQLQWWTLRHPTASVGWDADIGPGTLLAPFSVVTARVQLGAHCILNVKASVSHDAVVGDYVNVNPGAIVAGNVRLGEEAYVGAGATVIEKITIGARTVIGAGAAVVRDLPPAVTAVGVPARVIRSH
jgi:sugar O-acyltransferase (sialic acid O-acetyltransferase NeuD family)